MGYRVLVFLSSLAPVFVLLSLKYVVDGMTGEGDGWSPCGQVAFVLLMALSFGTVVFAVAATRSAYSRAQRNAQRRFGDSEEQHAAMLLSGGFCYYLVERVEGDSIPNLLSYLAICFLPCIGLSISRVSDCLTMAFVVAVVGFVYIRERATYVNPVLLGMGFRVCRATVRRRMDLGIDGSPSYAKPQNAMLLHRDADGLVVGCEYLGVYFKDYLAVIEAPC